LFRFGYAVQGERIKGEKIEGEKLRRWEGGKKQKAEWKKVKGERKKDGLTAHGSRRRARIEGFWNSEVGII
jgi:hypothetical protein